MPATSTAINACDVSLYVDNSSNELVDISGSSNGVTLDFSQEVEGFRVFGSRWQRRLACTKDATLSVNIIYTTAADEGLDLLRDWFFSAGSNTPRTVRILVPDNSPGSDDYQGEFIISSLSIPMDGTAAGPITVAVELMPDGEITHATTTT